MTKDEVFALVAKETMDVPTLVVRHLDRLDFHDIAVWEIKRAFERVWKAAQDAELRQLRKRVAALEVRAGQLGL